MTRTRSRALGLMAALALIASAPTAGGTADQGSSQPIAAAHTCKSGKHAVIGGSHKCLRRGQFCAHGKDSQYHKYGFHCHKKDGNGRYHLT